MSTYAEPDHPGQRIDGIVKLETVYASTMADEKTELGMASEALTPKLTTAQSERLLRDACDFQGRSLQARERCREQFKQAEREEDNVLRIMVDGQVASLESTLSRQIAKVDPSISYQIGVVTSYVRSHFVITDLILNGDLVEAVTLIRKQLESLARLHELDHKPLDKLQGRTPNVGIFFRHGGGEMYGHLSEVAHFSKPRVSDLMHVLQEGERTGPSVHPAFTEHSFACLDMHHFVAIYFLAWITEKIAQWYPGTDVSESLALLYLTIAFAKQIDVIRFPSE